MKCPQCSSDIGDDFKFCKECGTNISSGEPQPSFTKTLETPVESLTRGTLFADRYEIIEELGRGGMGEVFRVEDKKINEEVALKLIRPEITSDRKIIDRFSSELKTARRISHRNVCRMFDIGEEKGKHYITMEYIRGEDLKSLIEKMGRLSDEQTITIAEQVCDGLIEAHRLGIVHRDLKPQNVMVDREGNAKIMDFGIARSIDSKNITGHGMMIGTPAYMSPEQVDGKEADQRSDLYSLGIALYEMITGKLPFEGDTPFSIALKHKSEMPQDPQLINFQLSQDLSQLILKCIEKSPQNRYGTAQELKTNLLKVKQGMLVRDGHSTDENVQRAQQAPTSSFSSQKHKQITAEHELAKIIAYSQLLIKNDIMHVTFNRSGSVVTAINDISKKLLWDADDVFFINQGGGEITCIFDREKESLFKAIIPQAREIRKKAAVIRIPEPKDEKLTPGIEVPGLFAFFIGQVSDIGVNILDIISTGSQLTLVTTEEDLIHAYTALTDNIRHYRNIVESKQ